MGLLGSLCLHLHFSALLSISYPPLFFVDLFHLLLCFILLFFLPYIHSSLLLFFQEQIPVIS